MTDIGNLTAEQLEQIRQLQQRELRRRRRRDPTSVFRWHDIQKFVLKSPGMVKKAVRIMLVSGGNRAGKSKCGMGTIADLLRRQSPINDQLRTTDPYSGRVRRKTDSDPLTIWVVPPTLEKARQDWISPQDQMGLRHWCGDLLLKHQETPDNVFYCRPPGVPDHEMYDTSGKLLKSKCDKIIIKAHGQDVLSFESSEVDLVLFDEEIQNEQVWNSCLLRVATTNGVLMMTYTPLHGLSWTWRRYWRHLIENGAAMKIRDRCWIYDPEKGATVICAQMGSADNPKAREYAEEVEHDPEMSQAEKDARLYGQYGYVEGALIKTLSGLDVQHPVGIHKRYVVDQLPGQRIGGSRVPGKIAKWFLVADPNKSYGALLCALDADDNLYFVSEHLEESWPDRKHAQAFKEMEKVYARGRVDHYADPGSAGAQSMVNLADSGLFFQNVPKGAGSVSHSVKKMRGRTYMDPEHAHPISGKTPAPRLYFYRPGMVSEQKDSMGRMVMTCRLAEQINQARQTDNENAPPDTPHKDIRSKLDLFDCARYAAVIASEHAFDEGEPAGRKVTRSDSLPFDNELRKRNEVDIDPMNPDWHVPVYDFGGGETWSL